MARPMIAKSRRNDAEKAAEWYLYRECDCLIHTIRRAIRSKFQAVDFWGCDVMGKTPGGDSVFAQVTAGRSEAVRTRRRKLENIPWNPYDTVMLLQLVEQQDPGNMRKKNFYFRVHRFIHTDQSKFWKVDETAFPVPRQWFVKLRQS